MDEPSHHSDLKSEVAKEKPRDENGHFVHVEKPAPEAQSPHVNPVTQFLHDETAIHKTNQDELVDIHVGNPLHKIQVLLEDIKKQKAFSFSIKGSLGLMGIVVVLGTFGILGGTKALCSKGVQTKIGSLSSLSYAEETSTGFFRNIPLLNNFFPKSSVNRTILQTLDHQTLHVVFSAQTTPKFYVSDGANYVVTGELDSCSQTLTVTNPQGVEPLTQYDVLPKQMPTQ